jgi:hypothetical protein
VYITLFVPVRTPIFGEGNDHWWSFFLILSLATAAEFRNQLCATVLLRQVNQQIKSKELALRKKELAPGTGRIRNLVADSSFSH